MMMRAALEALDRGFHIFPCNPAGTVCPQNGRPLEKVSHLIRPNKPYTIKWGDAATNDVNQVVKWWSASPYANIGVAAKPSGILVVDCDVPKRAGQLKDTPYAYLHDRFGPLVDGTDVLREMCDKLGGNWDELYDTYRVCTASMGLHLYYRWPEGVEASQASMVKGILDIRCNGGEKGGYVLGAGSATVKGDYVAENNAPIRWAPAWLVERVKEQPRPKRIEQPFKQPGSASFGGLVDSVRLAPEGNRNNVLLWAARSMCEDGADVEEAYTLLVPAAQECGLDGGERQARQTIQSAYRLQQRKTG